MHGEEFLAFDKTKGVPKMKKILLITRGEKHPGYDSELTSNGREQITSILRNLVVKILPPPLILIGLGQSFNNICLILESLQQWQRVLIKHSIFCGIENSPTDYISLTDKNAFTPWNWFASLPNGALLCVNNDLVSALGLGDLYCDGILIEIDVEAKTGHQIIMNP